MMYAHGQANYARVARKSPRSISRRLQEFMTLAQIKQAAANFHCDTIGM